MPPGGKRVVINPLQRNQACQHCKHRKTRCGGMRPYCEPCLKFARGKGEDPSIYCLYITDPKPKVTERRRSSITSGTSDEHQPLSYNQTLSTSTSVPMTSASSKTSPQSSPSPDYMYSPTTYYSPPTSVYSPSPIANYATGSTSAATSYPTSPPQPYPSYSTPAGGYAQQQPLPPTGPSGYQATYHPPPPPQMQHPHQQQQMNYHYAEEDVHRYYQHQGLTAQHQQHQPGWPTYSREPPEQN